MSAAETNFLPPEVIREVVAFFDIDCCWTLSPLCRLASGFLTSRYAKHVQYLQELLTATKKKLADIRKKMEEAKATQQECEEVEKKLEKELADIDKAIKEIEEGEEDATE